MNESERLIADSITPSSAPSQPHHSSYESVQKLISFVVSQTSQAVWHLTVTVPQSIVDPLYVHTLKIQQQEVSAPGFKKGAVPLEYIQEHYYSVLITHVKEFFLKFTILNFVYDTIRTSKLPVAGEPRLESIDLKPHHDAHFRFAIDVLCDVELQEWKYLPFKAPKRKNYKDLDRQVEHFVAQEEALTAQYNPDLGISIGDWVLFQVAPALENHRPIFDLKPEQFWFKIGTQEVDNPLRTLLLAKRAGDIMYVNNAGLQHYFGSQLEVHHLFYVEILDILPNSFVSLELFKKHFRIKTNKDMNRKLIEVFSYRNDISQRRAMVESALKLLLSKHALEIPNHISLREQEQVLQIVQENPDYNVYRVQKDFNHRIRQLAEKQAREKILIDLLAFYEGLSISNHDVKCYLNLLTRARTKEFIYFKYEEPTVEGQEIPIPVEMLKRTCLREKTINYVIFQLTKK